MRQVLNPVVEQTETITQTDGGTMPMQVPGTGNPQHISCPPIAKCHEKNFYGRTREKVGRWVWLQRAPAERRKTFKEHLSVFSSCTIKSFSRGQVRAGNSRVTKRIMGKREEATSSPTNENSLLIPDVIGNREAVKEYKESW